MPLRRGASEMTDQKLGQKTATGNFFEDFQVGQELVHATPRRRLGDPLDAADVRL